MGNILITADLHLHPHRSDQRRVEDGLECLKWIYSTANIARIKTVVFAGDFLHHRFSLSSYAYSKACGIISTARDQGIATIMLLGNHDCYYEDNWSVNSLSPMQGLVNIVDSPKTIEIEGVPVDFLPYTPTPSRYLSEFTNPSSTLISHLAVADAVLNSKYDIKSVEDDSKDKEVISVSAFNRWKKVWLGHYHYGQKVSDNVEYIGSPMQLSFGEAGQNKYIAIYDTDTLETKYIENEISPKFHIVEDGNIPSEVTGSYIQMRSAATLDSKFDLRKELSKLGAREIEFCPISNVQSVNTKTVTALTNINSFFHDKEKLIQQYVSGVNPEGLDLETLRAIGISLVSSEG
jgi:DNA repair exonuclease SbcCD nuclease subunit